MKTYNRSERLTVCYLTAEAIIELEKLIFSDFQNSECNFTSVSVELEGAEVKEPSITAMLENNQLPDTLSTIRLSAHQLPWKEKKERGINLQLEQGGWSYLGVSGDDETWVLGKHQQISNFLRNRRPRYRLLIKILSNPILSILASIILLVVGGSVFASSFSVASLLIALFGLNWLILFMWHQAGSFLPNVRIIVRKRGQRPSVESPSRLSLRLLLRQQE